MSKGDGVTPAVSKAGDNNLDLVRFVLASMVFISHAHDLSGSNALSLLSTAISSTLAVQAFFVISGFLIFQSYERSTTLRSYASKRIRRILPAYVLVVVSCAVILGTVSSLPYQTYIINAGVWRYIAANLLFINFLAPELPGVFQGNLVHAVNGALWTLKIEILFYVVVPICVWLFRRFGRTYVAVGIYIASVIYGAGMIWLAGHRHSGAFLELSRQLPGQMTYFMSGALIYYNYDKIAARKIAVIVVGIVLFVISSYLFGIALRPIAVALCVFGVAFGPYFGKFGRYGDFSYGIYIVHFPVLQLMISLGVPGVSLPAFMLASTGSVLLIAVLMWHVVEKRFLRSDSHYRREAVAVAA